MGGQKYVKICKRKLWTAPNSKEGLDLWISPYHKSKDQTTGMQSGTELSRLGGETVHAMPK